ncbi:unnamed protein product [Vitrella brassicaformis CCMP3155]|uniref:PPM-type phosphatase domain-containing protein n=2 Tax=Vitrella brassicaformis TaxID=1169539 RepID=A0A0G4E8Q0_VITBC|nr:unnamed protein product [Vitrella brassicaformis CCMP3155]|eukprot:CEL91759.1 unnamed protein product [Vitrella brassicaformis CCMP3155]
MTTGRGQMALLSLLEEVVGSDVLPQGLSLSFLRRAGKEAKACPVPANIRSKSLVNRRARSYEADVCTMGVSQAPTQPAVRPSSSSATSSSTGSSSRCVGRTLHPSPSLHQSPTHRDNSLSRSRTARKSGRAATTAAVSPPQRPKTTPDLRGRRPSPPPSPLTFAPSPSLSPRQHQHQHHHHHHPLRPRSQSEDLTASHREQQLRCGEDDVSTPPMAMAAMSGWGCAMGRVDEFVFSSSDSLCRHGEYGAWEGLTPSRVYGADERVSGVGLPPEGLAECAALRRSAKVCHNMTFGASSAPSKSLLPQSLLPIPRAYQYHSRTAYPATAQTAVVGPSSRWRSVHTNSNSNTSPSTSTTCGAHPASPTAAEGSDLILCDKTQPAAADAHFPRGSLPNSWEPTYWPPDVLAHLQPHPFTQADLADRLDKTLNRPATRMPSSTCLSPGGTRRHGLGLTLHSGGCIIPRVDKAATTGGADAFFHDAMTSSVGVADGVGAWDELGLSAGAFAQELMYGCQQASQSRFLRQTTQTGSGDGTTTTQTTIPPALPPSMVASEILVDGYESTESIGSSTALVACLDGNKGKLGAATLGDSGMMVLRRSGAARGAHMTVVMQTRPMQHYFNCPYQLTRLPSAGGLRKLQEEGEGKAPLVSLLTQMSACHLDTPDMAQEYDVDVQEGDLLILGTDGLLDNLFDFEVCGLATMALSPAEAAKIHGDTNQATHPQRIARALAEAAYLRSHDKAGKTPYAKNGRRAGAHPTTAGGKPDDITVVACWVTKAVSSTLTSPIPSHPHHQPSGARPPHTAPAAGAAGGSPGSASGPPGVEAAPCTNAVLSRPNRCFVAQRGFVAREGQGGGGAVPSPLLKYNKSSLSLASDFAMGG